MAAETEKMHVCVLFPLPLPSQNWSTTVAVGHHVNSLTSHNPFMKEIKVHSHGAAAATAFLPQ